LADRLRLIGSAISYDLQLFILHSLSIEYDPLVIPLTSRTDAVPFNELTGFLLNHEQRLLKHNLAVAGTSSPSFPGSFSSSTSAFLGMPQACLASPSEDTDLMCQFSVFLASRGNWHGKPSNKPYNQPNSNRSLCQLCQKRGHTVDPYYKHFDSSYKLPAPRPPPRNAPQYQPPPQALSVQPGQSLLDFWYINSSASAQVTPNLNAFTNYSPYNGPEKLCVGDGNGLEIVHTASDSLSTTSFPLKLHNMLHVPLISKPLLSIIVYVEFNYDTRLVKALGSHQILLHSTRHMGCML
jgi:hypothetical protein